MKQISETDDPQKVLEIGTRALQEHEFGPEAFYEAMLAAIAKDADSSGITSGHADLALAVLEQLTRLGLNVSAETAKTAFELVAPTGDAVLAYKYWRLINQSNRLFTNAGRLELMDRMVVLLLSSGSLEAALFHVAEMRTINAGKGKLLSVHVNELLVMALLYARDMDAALEETRLLFQEAGNLYARTWGLFVSTACDTDHYDALHWAWKHAAIPGRVELDDWCLERMMDIGATNGDYEMVRWSFLRLRRRERGSEDNGHHARSYKLATSSDGELLDSAAGEHIQPLLRFVEARARANETHKAVDMVVRAGPEFASRVRLRDVSPLVSALAACSPQALGRIVHRYLRGEPSRHLPAATRTLVFNCLFAAAVEGSNLELATQLYSALSASGIVPTEDTFICMLQLASANRDAGLAARVVQDVQARGLPLTRRLLELAVRVALDAGDTITAEWFVDAMRLDGKPRAWVVDMLSK